MVGALSKSDGDVVGWDVNGFDYHTRERERERLIEKEKEKETDNKEIACPAHQCFKFTHHLLLSLNYLVSLSFYLS